MGRGVGSLRNPLPFGRWWWLRVAQPALRMDSSNNASHLGQIARSATVRHEGIGEWVIESFIGRIRLFRWTIAAASAANRAAKLDGRGRIARVSASAAPGSA